MASELIQSSMTLRAQISSNFQQYHGASFVLGEIMATGCGCRHSESFTQTQQRPKEGEGPPLPLFVSNEAYLPNLQHSPHISLARTALSHYL